MTRRIAAIDGTGRLFDFVCDDEDGPDVLHLVQPQPQPQAQKLSHRRSARHADSAARRRYFARRFREYRRQEEAER